jgi:hypothetical protein
LGWSKADRHCEEVQSRNRKGAVEDGYSNPASPQYATPESFFSAAIIFRFQRLIACLLSINMSGVLLPVLPAALMYELRSDLPIVIAFTKTLYYLPIPNLPERKIFAYSATSRRCAPSHTLTLDLQSITDERNK